MKPYSFIVISLILVSILYSQGAKNPNQSDPRRHPDYLLAISEAYNYLERGDYAQSGIAINGYLKRGENYADAYSIMGEILLHKKFYKQSENYLAEAENSRDYFIDPSQVIRLYWNQVYALSGSEEKILDLDQENLARDSDNITQEKIQNALDNLIAFASSHQGDYYREQLGRAYFMLGRIWYRPLPLKGMENLLQAAERNFLVKSANLYLSYFFAIQSQETIDQVYQDNLNRRAPPRKREAFLLYHRNYMEAKEDEALRKTMIPEPEYAAMRYAVNAYYQDLQR